MNNTHPHSRGSWLRRFALVAGVVAAGAAQAQFSVVPAPEPVTSRPSAAEIEKEYRIDAARHIYAAYPKRVFRGKLPPLLYSVMIVETEIDGAGQVTSVNVVRRPAVAEVAPFVTELIKRAAPFPVPAKLGTVRYVDIWLVDKTGLFQVDTLTEGQK